MEAQASAQIRIDAAQAQERYENLVSLVRAALTAIDDGQPPSVALGPLQAKVAHINTRWTPELVLERAQEWYARYRESPRSRDWAPWEAQARNPDADISRWAEGDWPSKATALRLFDGSWLKMLKAAGLPDPVRADNGGRRAGDTDHLPEWDGWKLIDEYRDSLGLSVAELARRSGLQPANVTKIARGEHTNPTMRTFLGLCAGLDVHPVRLLPGPADEPVE